LWLRVVGAVATIVVAVVVRVDLELEQVYL